MCEREKLSSRTIGYSTSIFKAPLIVSAYTCVREVVSMRETV